MATGNVAQFIAIFAGDPTGVDVSIFNPPKGALILDSTGVSLRWKTSELGDNSGYQQIAGDAGFNPNNVGAGEDITLPSGSEAAFYGAFTVNGRFVIAGEARFGAWPF